MIAWLLGQFPVEPLPVMLEALDSRQLLAFRDALRERFRRIAVPPVALIDAATTPASGYRSRLARHSHQSRHRPNEALEVAKIGSQGPVDPASIDSTSIRSSARPVHPASVSRDRKAREKEASVGTRSAA